MEDNILHVASSRLDSNLSAFFRAVDDGAGDSWTNGSSRFVSSSQLAPKIFGFRLRGILRGTLVPSEVRVANVGGSEGPPRGSI